MDKKVVSLDWSSLDGCVEFRPVYDDGSKGFVVQAGFDTNDSCLSKKMTAAEKDWIGRQVPD